MYYWQWEYQFIFDEVEGFIRENNAIHYNKSDVYEIPSNNETSILIMKKRIFLVINLGN